MRKGVKWHDGQPVTAKDVVFSFDTIINSTVDAADTRQAWRFDGNWRSRVTTRCPSAIGRLRAATDTP